jgi:hypothetical protein
MKAKPKLTEYEQRLLDKQRRAKQRNYKKPVKKGRHEHQ